MIFKYYNFLIESVDIGMQKHYLIGVSISLIICIIISVIIVSRVHGDKSDMFLAIFSTTLGSIVLSFTWPLVLYLVLGGFVLPVAIIGGTITALTYITKYMKKYTSTKEEKYTPRENKTC
jgi:hypothetical protein